MIQYIKDFFLRVYNGIAAFKKEYNKELSVQEKELSEYVDIPETYEGNIESVYKKYGLKKEDYEFIKFYPTGDPEDNTFVRNDKIRWALPYLRTVLIDFRNMEFNGDYNLPSAHIMQQIKSLYQHDDGDTTEKRIIPQAMIFNLHYRVPNHQDRAFELDPTYTTRSIIKGRLVPGYYLGSVRLDNHREELIAIVASHFHLPGEKVKPERLSIYPVDEATLSSHMEFNRRDNENHQLRMCLEYWGATLNMLSMRKNIFNLAKLISLLEGMDMETLVKAHIDETNTYERIDNDPKYRFLVFDISK